MRSVYVLILLLFTALPTSLVQAHIQKLEFHENKGRMSALAIGMPSFLKVNVSGTGPYGELIVGEDKLVSGTLKLNFSKLDTGIGLRDSHLKNKYLEVAKFKESTLTLSALRFTETFGKDLQFTGELKIKDTIKKVSGSYQLAKVEDGGYRLTAKFAFKMSEFPIGIPSYSGITMADEVKVEVESQVIATDGL